MLKPYLGREAIPQSSVKAVVVLSCAEMIDEAQATVALSGADSTVALTALTMHTSAQMPITHICFGHDPRNTNILGQGYSDY